MTKNILSLTALMLVMCVGTLVAQNNTNSPYTRYGYGQLSDMGSANSLAMGGTAYGLRDKYQVNFMNPASYTAVDSLTFIFDGGLSLQNTNFSNGTLKQNAKNSSFDYITMEFRAAKWAAISLGLLPYSNVGYNLGEYREDEANTSVQYYGNGGLHQLYVGAGFKLFENFSIGANISYLWGNVTHTAAQNFPLDTSKFPVVIQSSVDMKSYKLDIGAQYTQQFGKKHAITLGVAFTPGHDMKSDAVELRQTGDQTSGNITVSQTDLTGAYGIPSTWGAGLAYVYDKRLTVAADVMLQDWDKVSYQGSTDAFCKRTRFSLGAELQPNPMGRNYLSHVKYRLGGYYSQPYYKIAGVRAAREFGLTAGFALPIPRTRSMLNIAGQYVRTKGTQAAFLDENTMRLCIGVTFNERWFFKRKVD